ncbi:MAG: hypothetical protein ACXW1U_14125 [Methylobacter sp.]
MIIYGAEQNPILNLNFSCSRFNNSDAYFSLNLKLRDYSLFFIESDIHQRMNQKLGMAGLMGRFDCKLECTGKDAGFVKQVDNSGAKPLMYPAIRTMGTGERL